MTTRTDSPAGRLALMVAHCAGMVDLVALPVWVGTLIARYGFDPQQAGLLASLDRSGRALAATPAMLMVGAAIGPVLGGTLVKALGYGSLGLAALAIGTLAVLCFMRLPSHTAALPRTQALA